MPNRWPLVCALLVLLGPAARGQASGDEKTLKAAFEAIQAAAPEPARDAVKFRTDPGWRRRYRAEVEKAAARRKQMALSFLDRHAKALAAGVGLFYKGLALKLLGRQDEAVQAFRRFRREASEHPQRERAALEAADCLLNDAPDLTGAVAIRTEERRLRQARRWLARLGSADLTTEQRRTVARLEKRLAEGVLRAAYAKMALGLELGQALERRYYHRARDRARKEAVRDFFRKYRAALDRDTGLLWRARALKLAGDAARAAAAYRRFHQACPEHPARAAAALEWARLLAHRLGKLDEAGGLLKELGAAALTADERQAFDRLHAFVERELARRAIRERRLDHPLPSFPVLAAGAGGPPFERAALRGKIVVLVFYAGWSTPSRELLLALRGLEHGARDVRVVGVTRLFGFGWEATGLEKGVLRGKPAGAGLTPEREHALAGRLRQVAALDYPLVFTDEATLRDVFAVEAFPTVFVVDAAGVVRHEAVGAASVAKVTGWVEALRAARR